MTRNTVIVFLFVILSFLFFSLKEKKVIAVDCSIASSILSQGDKDSCQNELSQIERELADLLKKQAEQQKQSGTIKGDITLLTTQISALKTKIKARSLVIANLKNSIKEKVSTITTLSEKIEREHESLAQLLRNTNEFDNENITHLVLSNDTISDYYSDLESYDSIKEAVKASVDEINGIKVETETEKKNLEVKQNAETDAKAELESAQKKVAQSEADKKQLLVISKQKESAYQQLANEQKIKANKIRSALFSLAGISQKIEFGTALQYANEAKEKIGIDPAFLLAIITKESELGANVGQCYLTNPETGAGVGKNTGKVFPNVMKPTRDVGPFLEITKELGLDPFKSIVSCPIVSKTYWNSGSFGPAQFLPSTWKLFANRLQNILGHYPNPWSPADAFMASSVYLTDLGGVGESTSAQRKAACKYNGGGAASSTCYYGQSVISLKNKIQDDIDYLNQYGVAR